jgi:hypothetical protein
VEDVRRENESLRESERDTDEAAKEDRTAFQPPGEGSSVGGGIALATSTSLGAVLF